MCNLQNLVTKYHFEENYLRIFFQMGRRARSKTEKNQEISKSFWVGRQSASQLLELKSVGSTVNNVGEEGENFITRLY